MINIETVTANGISMDYFQFGNGPKTCVIIPGLSIQSVMDAADSISDGYDILSKDFTVYVLDRRKNLPNTYTIYEMAKDTVYAIKELGLKNIYLFGASQGGMIAMTIAVKHPALVKKLVLGSTSSHVTPAQLEALNKWIALAENGDREGLYLNFGEMLYPPQVYEQNKEYFINASRYVTDEDLRRFIILASGTKGFHITEVLKAITCPVLAIGVYEDKVLDSDATMELAEQMDWNKNFNLYMYIGFGHAAFDTAPDYRKRIYDFFMKD
ncbi:MAG: alpha/beta hydrolase [Lachnospiraceae bacterium]|nr:alpha/beta hydrolase [Lachnospiraceae bacterium]